MSQYYNLLFHRNRQQVAPLALARPGSNKSLKNNTCGSLAPHGVVQDQHGACGPCLHVRAVRPYVNKRSNLCIPVHVTINERGNQEGLQELFQDPQLTIFEFKQMNFRCRQVEMVKATHILLCGTGMMMEHDVKSLNHQTPDQSDEQK